LSLPFSFFLPFLDPLFPIFDEFRCLDDVMFWILDLCLATWREEIFISFMFLWIERESLPTIRAD